MKNSRNRFLAVALACTLLTANMSMLSAFADSTPIVTVGADLSEAQLNSMLDFFGLQFTDEELANMYDSETNTVKGGLVNGVEVVVINNAQEHEYLDDYFLQSDIGTHTLSCSYILPMESGGIVVRTANLTRVSDGMIANALVTAGIENCQVIASSPILASGRGVSGTGALTGILVSYEKSAEVELDEEKKALATEELAVTDSIVSEVVTPDTNTSVETVEGETGLEAEVKAITEARVLEMLNEIKAEIINGNLSKEEIEAIVDKHLEAYKIELTEELYNKLVEYLMKLTKVSYSEQIKESLSGVTERIKTGFDKIDLSTIKIEVSEDTKNWFEKIIDAIVNFFKSIFGGGSDEESSDDSGSITETVQNIFNDINTDVFKFDNGANGEEPEEEEANAEDIADTVNNEEASVDDNTAVEIETIVSEENIPEPEPETVINEEVYEENVQEEDGGIGEEQGVNNADASDNDDSQEDTNGNTGLSLDDIIAE